MAKIIKCPTEKQDGSRCDFTLQPIFKVCPVCEKKVDPAWFRESPSPDEVEAPYTGSKEQGSNPRDANRTSPDKNGHSRTDNGGTTDGNSHTNNGGTTDGNSHTNNGGTPDSGNPVTQTVIGETSVDNAGPSAESNGKWNGDKGGATNETQTNGSPKPKQQTTKVWFHAFLSPTVDFNMKKDILYVVFGPERDAWEYKDEGVMKPFDCKPKGRICSDHKREKNHHGLRMLAEVELEKELLKNGLSYKYCILRKANITESIENEFFFQQCHPFFNDRRGIKVPHSIDSYQQYDGYIYAKKGASFGKLVKNVFGSLSNSSMIETMKNDGEFALGNYLPDIKTVIKLPHQDPSMMMEAFNDYTQVFKGGIKHHFMVSRSKYGPNIWQEFIMTDHLKAAILMLDIDSNKVDKNQRLLKALLIVALLYDLEIPHDLLDNSIVEVIHQALLLLPNTTTRTCGQLDFLESVLEPSMKSHVKQCLVWFLKKTTLNTEEKTQRNPSWILCIPIIQFLSGSLHPFEELYFENFHDEDSKWWSVDEFEKEKEELKVRKWSRSLSEMMTLLKPLFEFDTKTQRGFMACLNLEDLEIAMREESILLEIKLATLQHFFEKLKCDWEMEILGKCAMTMCQLYEKLLNKLPSDTTKREWSAVDKRYKIQQDKCTAILTIGMDKMVKSQLILRNIRILVSLFHCNMLSLAVLERISTDSDELKSLQMRAICLIDDILLEIGKDFGGYEFALSILETVMESQLTRKWKTKCLLYAKKALESTDARERIEFYYGDSMKALQIKSLRDVFHRVIMESIDEILQDERIRWIDAWFSWSDDSYKAQFLSGIFSQLWKIDVKASESEFIRNALNFTVYPKCVGACLRKTKVFQALDQTTNQKLTHSISIMTSLFKKLSENAVPIAQLELICSRKETFIAVACVFENFEENSIQLTRSALENLLHCREKDLKCLEEVISTVEKLQFLFKEICENSNIRIHKIDEDTLRNWKLMEVRRVCNMQEDSVGWNQYQPQVSLFRDLLSSLGAFVTNIHFYHDSKSFYKILRLAVRKYRHTQDFGFDDVVDKILLHTQRIWEDLFQKNEKGSILVNEIEKYRFNEFSDEELHKEFVVMNRGQKPPWIRERINQLHRFRQFSKTVAVAKLMVDVRDKYDIEGSFQNLELIANSDTEKDIPLKDLKLSVQGFNEKLENINNKQKESISSFLKCKDLVDWLRNALPGGVKDLKIYADLALLSVEGDEQVGRVTSLHSATIGYSPMIFRIEDINGELEMIERWNEVWQSLEKDDDLPQKLEISNRLLHWLKEIKESHGSVEVTSLKQVDAIKDRGIFNVGNSLGTAVKSKHQLELNDVIWLRVPGVKIVEDTIEELDNSDTDHNDDEVEIKERDRSLRHMKREIHGGEGRDYTLGEMTDLQSRLMLVTGKADAGRESIERFTSIFDNVTRLGKVFIQLHASGCILFKRWTFEFHCNQTAGSSVLIKTHEQSVVKGTNYSQVSSVAKDTESNVNEYIRSIANFMESCYKQWIEYIRDKRSAFYPLNFYTVDQMVLLQEGLALYRNGHATPKYLCPLLSLVKSQCSLHPDVEDAVNKVQEKLLTREQTSHMEKMSDKTSHEEAIQRFLQVCEEASISRKHALCAIKSQEFKIEDADAGLLWCLTNDESEDDETLQETVTERDESMQNSTMGNILRESIEELEGRQQEIDQVILNLNQIWKKFLDCASSSATDFLSIDHLGMILEILYQTESCILKRTLIDPLKSGKPNLIVCSQFEVISTMLTIYMMDRKLPLPTRNEVLLCTKSTPKEEVSIFFRRALFQNESDPNERIFCLMNADMLQYDASEQSLKEVTEYVKSATGDYKLVIICGSENEYKSPMISALDRFRAPKIAPAATAKIQEYLRTKYSLENTSDAAAAVDPTGCCVRVVKSERAGMGKTLYKTRIFEKLSENHRNRTEKDFPLSITIPMSQEKVDVSEVSKRFLDCTPVDDLLYPRIIHIDIANGVEKSVGSILFNILILGSTVDESGYVFHRSEKDLYIIETTLHTESEQDKCFVSSLQLLNILPSVTCISPEDTLGSQNEDAQVVGFDRQNFQSDEYQRPVHYLTNYDDRSRNIPVFNAHRKEEDMKKHLRVLIRHCCVANPSWAELRNFVHFLNTQLMDFEKSVFCGATLSWNFPGFPSFVLRFLVQMSKDFSTRSLDISEGKTNSHSEEDNDLGEADDNSSDDNIGQFQMRRRWETSAHPYLFFNPDQHTMTFIGFNIDKCHRNLVDQQTGSILEQNIMSSQLWEALKGNHVPLQETFDDLSRRQKIERLCKVIGNDVPQDPDETYELTTDNVKKMLAIYMRFRCNIPVIVMGETGCGKTRLIKFLCSLQRPAGLENQMNTMTLMKVHGGTKKKHIVEKVKQAESLAQENCDKFGKHIISVLFFDEANTTEAVGCIKEIMCDGTIDGEPLATNTNLKIVAACNPYRKHSEEMIERLERAGLGYHVNAHETEDKLGRIPMRHLVYRVQPLPQSMLSLVWDFGQLDNNVEKLYIVQMVQRCVRNGALPHLNMQEIDTVSNILAASQDFMRKQKDECSFVSLRDVERTLKVFGWLYKQNEIFTAMDQLDDDDDEEDIQSLHSQDISRLTKSLLLALGVCYHSSLKSREEYREYIVKYFESPFELFGGQKQMEREITRCQMSFLQNVKLNENIAKNLALRENFFMMVVCVELRIPLFLVGKPGSSKSLSKTILDHNMQGRDSQSHFFKSLKQVQLISFQCSPLATADGILKTFKQASSFQRSKDLDKFVSVVVLDEVGLAEDSPRMPLKALHPLLEDGCPDDEEFEDYKKVSFIGISNWALDPAKMNRGILVQRDVPNEPDLVESTRGICQYDEKIYPLISNFVPPLVKGYLHVFEKAYESETLFGNSSEDHLKAREFFGLRDFYSLVKMICAIASKTHRSPNEQELATAIKRNFGGLEGLDPVQDFGKCLPTLLETRNFETDTALLRECLKYDENKMESRYILLLTENYGALNLLHQLMGNERNTHVIFGSSFPRDQEYIEICRNINRIKVFMETGKTVVLLNLENLYESLYDALNQYYMESGPDRYIDLGLGTHRVKCKVDKKFRLIVIAEKRIVYREFPIPLINRLEKHFLTMEGTLTETQLKLSRDLEQWAKEFSNNSDSNVQLEEIFIGYNKDTAAGVILKAWDMCSKQKSDSDSMFRNSVMETAKDILLWGSTPDAVLRLVNSTLQILADEYFQKYFRDQCHKSLCDFLKYRHENEHFGGNFIQITTHSKLLSVEDKRIIERNLPFLSGKISLLSLKAFDTEHQFSCQIRNTSEKGNKMLLVQCDTGGENSNLVECARYCVQREIQSNGWDVCVVFLVHLSRVSKTCFSGFQTGLWTSVHIDELRSTSLPCIHDLMTKTISSILLEGLCSRENFAEVTEDETVQPIVQQEHQLNFRKILFDCIHPALASIKELDDREGRAIERIKFIFKELNQNKQLIEGHFAHGLMKHIVSMLSKHDKEKMHPGDTWIHSEAATPVSVNKTGTLRSSCQKVIEEKITPLLAKIVAYVDTDNNLSLLESADEEANWVTNLWLGIFTSIDLEDVNKIKVPRMQSTGAGHLFTAKFPFSWLIYEAVEKFLIVTSENKIGKTAEQLFMESATGIGLLQHVNPGNMTEATRLYISDFVHISRKIHSDKEEMIICEAIHVCFEEGMVGKKDNFASQILCIHDSYRKIKDKLDTFSDVLCLVSCLNDTFFQKIQSDCKELDVAAVRYLLDAMEPNEMAIDTATGQANWIQNVQRYRPVIERLLQGRDKEETDRSRLLADIRRKWTKVVVFKLFIQSLCVETSREKLMTQTCKVLWKIMGENANFKDKGTLDKLEKFLRASNSKAMTEFLGKFGKCNHCGKSFDTSPPVVLPCDHKICREECFSVIDALPEVDKACPVNKCSRIIPEEFDENETPENQKKQMKLFTEYQEKCNKFYLHVVSQLCFENSSPPSEDVCQRLLQLVMHKKEIPQLNMTIIRTRRMTIFETVVDTTPVFRSFLLQLLIRTNEEIVFRHLEEILGEANAIFQESGNTNHALDLSLMLNQCIEDSLLEQLFHLNHDREKEIDFVDRSLSYAMANLQSNSGAVDKIRSIATARFCLQITAKYLKECYSSKSKTDIRVYEGIFQKASTLCQLPIQHIRIFLLTHICRSYGLDLYQFLLRSIETRLFCDEANNRMEKCPDYCIVLGDTYTETRERVAESLLVRKNRIDLKITWRSDSVQICFLLALLKEVKFRDIVSDVGIDMTCQFIKGFKKEFARQNLQIVLSFLDGILDDSFAKSCKQFRIGHHRDIRDQGIIMLLLHFMMVFKTLSANEILQPLVHLATQPRTMKGSFLPTMPEECLSQEITAELHRLEELADKHYHTVRRYGCPNDHPYAVGDCGNSTQLGRCYQCKAEIGGESSNLRQDNVKDAGSDFSHPGHILGSPDGRITQAFAERTLSPSSNALLRFVSHMAMFIGANDHTYDICSLIQPAIPAGIVPDFLWEHINKDIDTIGNALDCSVDEVFMFLHSVIHSFVKSDTSYSDYQSVKNGHLMYSLSTKEGRQMWERDFDETFLTKKLQTHQEFFEHCREILSNDKSIGSDPFLKSVYRKERVQENQFSTSDLQLSSSMWKYRMRVSFEHFVHEFHVQKDKHNMFHNPYVVLDTFLQQEWYLRYMSHIPKVLLMQKLLITKFGKQITREEADKITMHDCVAKYENDPSQENIVEGFSSFCELWNNARHSYEFTLFCGGNEELQDLLQRNLKTKTDSIRVLLPDTQGIGKCSRILLGFFIGKQNIFLTACGSTIDPRFDRSQKLTVDNLTSMHFISFKRETDIFPIILANCNYTYMPDENTKLEYDFENIQDVLQDRILFGKHTIDTSKGFPVMMYKADASVSLKFSSLTTRIPQEALNRAVQSEIAMEFSDLPELYETINNIDAVVNFLLSVNCIADISLNSFMEETLQMKPLPSQKAAQCCKLSHIQSLWFVLTFEKTKRLHQSKKDAFDSINKSIQEILSYELVQELDNYLNELSVEKLHIFLEQLLEFMLFSLNCGERDVSSYQYSLMESLMIHIDNPVYLDVDLKSFRPDDIQRLPAKILSEHSVEVWKKIHRLILSRE